MITISKDLTLKRYVRLNHLDHTIISIDTHNKSGGLFLWRISRGELEDVDDDCRLKIIGVDAI